MKNEPIDAVVIGSGFGGAVAALRLGEAGYRTVVLERGQRWPVTEQRNTFATYDKPDGRAAWLSSTTVDPINPGIPIPRYTGILDRTVANGIAVLSGVGVGGGSLVFTGALVQPLHTLFARLFPPQIDYELFEAIYYPRVRALIRPSSIPDALLAHEAFASSRLFLKWIQRAGLAARFFEMAMDWSRVQQEMAGEIEPHLLTGQEMWYGLNSGARLSLDTNYLALAEVTKTTTILPLHEVTEIEAIDLNGEEHYRVSGQRIDTQGTVQGEFSFLCRYLFVAAGSIKTSALLVRSKARGLLPRLNASVGQGWGNNGDVISIHGGHSFHSRCAQLPAGLGGFDLQNALGSVLLQGDVLNSGGYTDSLLTLAMVLPAKNTVLKQGSFHYDQATDSVSLHWPHHDSPLLEIVGRTYARLDDHSATKTYLSSTALTMHPCGGMVLGKACDLGGRVHGYQNLYVTDSSLLPGSAGCANPAFTIAAFAEYIMDQFFKRQLTKRSLYATETLEMSEGIAPSSASRRASSPAGCLD